MSWNLFIEFFHEIVKAISQSVEISELKRTQVLLYKLCTTSRRVYQLYRWDNLIGQSNGFHSTEHLIM